MSRIDDLLRELAPDGVKVHKLGDIAQLMRGNGMPKIDLTDEGVGAIHYGQIYTYYRVWATKTLSFVTPETSAKLAKAEPGDIIITNTSENLEDVGKAVAWLGEQPIVTGGHATVIKHGQDPKYLAYWFQSQSFFMQKKRLATGTKVIDVSAKQLMKVQLPIPPLPVQREIVRILDQFTQLEAELEAELQARRRQYEHYRDQLLMPDDDAVRWARLGDVADFRRGTAITAKSAVPGDVRVVANAPDSTYSHAVSNRDGETVVIARSGAYAGLVSFWRGPIFLTDAFSVHPNPDVLSPRFAFYLLQARQTQLHAFKAGAGVPHVRVRDVEAYEVPIPNRSEQDRIVEILDMFDALVNDPGIGIPAEIAARRKQYEYYRDRLLTFAEGTS